ncbi:TonB-dependent receptor [uncultured Tenacibaculum sp.]|uniref:TonB-dependent receptor plug domain-containing protein n=1 Tax=uncultured Tenacibaculum sp. TaxID=174713 RepID=UPI002603D041|nr:TonB-dependent receptor [uncultured Tenacibaculum sp.]
MFLNKCFGFLICLITLNSFSQEKKVVKDTIDDRLDEVVVTATRTKRQLSSLPMPVTLISKKQILATGSTRLRDIIAEQTGIIIVSDVGNSEGVQMQGVAADYVLILINGLPLVGRTSGNIDLNRLSVNNIKQIEIVKGPSSSLYGSEALGGVINIITKTPDKDKTSGNVSFMTRFLAREELDLNANLTHQKNKLGLDASVNLNSGGAYDLSPETPGNTGIPYQNFTGNLRLFYELSDQLQINTDARYLNEEVFEAAGDSEKTDFYSSINVSHQLTDAIKIDYLLFGTRFKTESVFNGTTSVFDRTLYRPEIKAEFDFSFGNIIAGAGGNFDGLERTFFEGNEQYNAKYLFGQYDTNIGKDLNVILGFRYDTFNKFKSAFSPKLSANYKINNWLTTKVSVGFGYKVPDFRHLFFNFRNTASGYIVLGTHVLEDLYGDRPEVQNLDKELKPESSIGYNFGFQLKPLRGVRLNINFFRNDFKDLINTFAVTRGNFPDLPGVSVFSYENRAEVFTQGVEVDVNYKINNNLRFSTGYQFLDTGDKQELDAIKSGTVFFRRTPSSPSEILTTSQYFGLPNRSKHIVNAKLFYENFEHDFSANVRVLYRSKYALFDTNNSGGIIDNYDAFIAGNTQVNTALQKTFFNLMSVQLGVDNVFDSRGTENLDDFPGQDSALRLGRTFYTRIQFNL